MRQLGAVLFCAASGHAQPATEGFQPSPQANQGEHTPEPLWQSVRLHVDVEPAVSECPQQPELTTWVNQLVGRSFIADAATIEVRIVVRRSQDDKLVVEVFASDRTIPQQAVVLRRFERALSCDELLRAAALTISLFAKSPEDGGRGAVLSFPESEPENLSPPPVTEGDGDTQPLPPAASTPPAAVPNATPPSSSGSATEAESRAPVVQAQQSNEPRAQVVTPTVAADTTPSSVALVVGTAGLGALGLNPGVGLGGTLYAGVHVAQWDLLVRGGYLASTGQQLTPAGGSIYGSTSELFLAACPTFTARVALRVCGSVGSLWVYAKGRGFDSDRRALLTALTAGGSAELLIAASPGLALGARLELLFPFAPVKYAIEGGPDASWTMWRVVPRTAIGVEWR